MCEPPNCPRDREEHREHVCGEAKGGVDHAGVEVDIGLKFVVDEVFIGESDTLQLDGDVSQGLSADHLEHRFHDALDDAGPRVLVLVHSMSEPHQSFFLVFDLLDKIRYVFHVSDFLEHSENGFVGSPMRWALESDSRATQHALDVCSAGGQVADSSR